MKDNPPISSHAVRNVSMFNRPSLLLEFDSAKSKEQFTVMIEKNDFLLTELNPKAHICPRAYTVIFRFIPCDASFDLSNDEHLHNIEEENDLQAGSIAAVSWCKCPNRRSSGQTTTTLKIACAKAEHESGLPAAH